MPSEATAVPPAGEPEDSGPIDGVPAISREQIAFDLVLLAFLIALALALPSSESARLVPLMILVPTILGVAYQLYVDLTPRRHPDEAAEDEVTPPDVRRRQLIFVGWLIAYFVAAWITSFLIVIPIALFAIFRFANRESLLLSIALAAGMSAFIFLLFGLILGVRF